MTHSGTYTVLSTFDDAATARRALDALAKEGFLAENMRVEPAEPIAGDADASRSLTTGAPRHGMARIERFFERLLGRGEHAQHVRDYSQAVRSGRSVVVVDTSSEVSAERAATVMQELGAGDVTQRGQDGEEGTWSQERSGERELADGTVVRWRTAHVVYRPSGEPLTRLSADE